MTLARAEEAAVVKGVRAAALAEMTAVREGLVEPVGTGVLGDPGGPAEPAVTLALEAAAVQAAMGAKAGAAARAASSTNVPIPPATSSRPTASP